MTNWKVVKMKNFDDEVIILETDYSVLTIDRDKKIYSSLKVCPSSHWELTDERTLQAIADITNPKKRVTKCYVRYTNIDTVIVAVRNLTFLPQDSIVAI